jgi:hypothetical protein
VYYKLVKLSSLGVKVHLHCFNYGRERVPELREVSESVHYYNRESGSRYLVDKYPYIVATRASEELTAALNKDTCPVLFEGLHTTACLPDLSPRNILVRTHNIEHNYYKGLARAEQNIARKMYFMAEAAKLRRYEKVLRHASHILAISPADTEYFRGNFGHTTYLPAFHPFTQVTASTGMGKHILFHGNLSVPENVQAAGFFMDNLGPAPALPVIIAGKDPHASLVAKAAANPNITLIANPPQEQMQELVAQAHVNVLLTFQSTGIKLKLLNALFLGKHCLVNPQMTEGTSLAHLCTHIYQGSELNSALHQLAQSPFTQSQLDLRQTALMKEFDTNANTALLLNLLND